MLANIQALRCLAAFAVVLHHLQFSLHGAYQTPYFALFGRAGVDLFFVISGFIMVHTTRDGARTTTEFWTDRATRILPMYWLATGVIVVFYLAGLEPNGLTRISPQDVAASLILVPDARSDGPVRPVLDLGWTLIYEAYFYALFGLTFFLKSQLRAVALLGGLFAALSLVRWALPGLPDAARVYFNPITLEFIAGAVIALVYHRTADRLAGMPKGPARLAGWSLFACGIALVLAAGWRFGWQVNDRPELRLLAFGGPSAMIVAGALILEAHGVWIRSRLVLLLGAASYSLYLFHPLVLQGSVQLLSKALPGAGPIELALASAIAILLSGLAGVALHIWVEKPVTAALKIRLGRRPRTAVASTGSAPA